MTWGCSACLPNDFTTCSPSVVILLAADQQIHEHLGPEHTAWLHAWSVRSLMRSILASAVSYFCSSFYPRNQERRRISKNVLTIWELLFPLLCETQEFSLISDHLVFHLYANYLLRILSGWKTEAITLSSLIPRLPHTYVNKQMQNKTSKAKNWTQLFAKFQEKLVILGFARSPNPFLILKLILNLSDIYSWLACFYLFHI